MMVCRYLSRMGYSVLNVANGIAYYRGKYAKCQATPRVQSAQEKDLDDLAVQAPEWLEHYFR